MGCCITDIEYPGLCIYSGGETDAGEIVLVRPSSNRHRTPVNLCAAAITVKIQKIFLKNIKHIYFIIFHSECQDFY